LTLLICKRRGGEVVAHNTSDGAQFIARMTVSPASIPATNTDRASA
jgi:hypothetical protein